ncbi:hypothetical protein EI94DRAFT_1699861 [Lactarius quietus]|nr:hypothetical protein EI94DRAFT_1699861 [Lactarius quietus]
MQRAPVFSWEVNIGTVVLPHHEGALGTRGIGGESDAGEGKGKGKGCVGLREGEVEQGGVGDGEGGSVGVGRRGWGSLWQGSQGWRAGSRTPGAGISMSQGTCGQRLCA